MSVDYSRIVLDWDPYVEFVDHIAESNATEGQYWDLWNDFCDVHKHDHESGSEFEGTSYDCTSKGQELSELYLVFRGDLQDEQRILWDSFFVTLLPQEFSSYCEKQACLDLDSKRLTEQTYVDVALNPDSVRKLFDVWKSLDMEMFKDCTQTALDDERIRIDPYPNVDAFIFYIRSWGRLVEYAAETSRGLTVNVAI